MQPNNSTRQSALQVDVQRVIEAESGEYVRMIQQLVRNNAVLSTALDDVQAECNELRAKVRALSGAPAQPSPVMSRPGASGGRPAPE